MKFVNLAKARDIISTGLRWLAYTLLTCILLFALLVIMVRIPVVQNFLVHKITDALSAKLEAPVKVKSLYLTFSGGLEVEELFMGEPSGDTLAYIDYLNSAVAIMPILNGNIQVAHLRLKGARINLTRGTDSLFNFSFIPEAFAQQADSESTDSSNARPPGISLGPISIEDFRLLYLDSLTGIDLSTQIQKLAVNPQEIDLADYRFFVSRIELSGSSTNYTQFSPIANRDADESSILPEIGWDQIIIRSSDISYHSLPDSTELKGSLNASELSSSKLNLVDSVIELGKISLTQPKLHLHIYSAESSIKDTAPHSTELVLPRWNISSKGLQIERASLVATRPGQSDKKGFDPADLQLSNLNLDLSRAAYRPDHISAEIKGFAGVLNDTFKLEHLALEALLTSDVLKINRLSLNTESSRAVIQAQAGFSSWSSLISSPQNLSDLDVSIKPNSYIDLREFLYFLPSLDTLDEFKAISKQPIYLSGEISGSWPTLKLSPLEIKALHETNIRLAGTISQPSNLSQFNLNLSQSSIQTSASDLAAFMDTNGMSLPQFLSLDGQIAGSMEEATANFSIHIPEGKITGDVSLADLEKIPSYRGRVTLDKLDLTKWVSTDAVDPITSDIKFTGSGTELANLNLDLEVNFDALVIENNNFSAAVFKGNIHHQNVDLSLALESEALIFTSNLKGYLDSLANDLQLEFLLTGADLYQLGITLEPFKASLDLHSQWKGSPSDFDLHTAIDRIYLIGNGESFHADSLFLLLSTASDSTHVKLSSGIASGFLQSNSYISDILPSIKHKLGLLDSTSFRPDPDFMINTSVEARNTALLSSIILPDLNKLDSLSFSAKLRPESDLLEANLRIPEVDYGQFNLKDLNLEMTTNQQSSDLDLGFNKLSGRWIDMGITRLSLDRNENMGSVHFMAMTTEDNVDYKLNASFEALQAGLKIHLKEDSLMFNEKTWQIAPDNYFSWNNSVYDLQNFNLKHEGQNLNVQTNPSGSLLNFYFTEFDLNVIFGLLNNDQDILAGKLNGSFEVRDIWQTPGYTADLDLDQLSIKGKEVGHLSLDAKNPEANNYNLLLSLQGPEVDLRANGQYNTATDRENLVAELEMKKLGLPLLESMLVDAIQNSKGYLSANLKFDGSLKNPDFDGNILFNEVGFKLQQTGGYYRLNQAQLSVSNSGLQFDQFKILDENKNSAKLSGSISTANAINPEFDLDLVAKDFKLLEVEEDSNELYFGKIITDLDIQIQGDLNLPKIKSQVVLKDQSNFTYIVPASRAEIESMDGLVKFEDMEDTLKFMRPDDESEFQTIKGMDINSKVILNEGTQIKMILDPRSGDNLSITGAADLHYLLSPNGNMSLTGIYELNSGGYNLNLFELVKKEFDIRDGSKVVWTGKPMGADLNITAVYESKTSAASLMNDPDPRFNRVLPFQVLLHIDGTIDQPEISFELDMPPDKRGSLSGDVYGRIQEINNNESELNKQVFGLIVFDKFIPSSESGDAGVSTADIALSSVSGFLSSQLNFLSEKYLQGVELDVNIGSYTDYGMGAGQQRTDLNVTMKKAFFDDRFVLELGSNVALQGYQPSNQIVGDVALEYKLTEDGIYRLRGYRRNDFENPIDGQVIITGLGLIFSREFNNWDELFDRPTETDSTESEKPVLIDE